MPLDWSAEQNKKSLAKARAKRDAEEAKTLDQRDKIRTAQLERLKTQLAERVEGTDANTATVAVRAFVEGEVYTFEPEAREASNAIAELKFELDRLKTDLAIMRPDFVTAWAAKTTAIGSDLASAAMAKRSTLSHQSRLQLWSTFTVLVLLETLFQRRPLELIVRNQLPEADSLTITVAAIATSVGIVTISTFILLLAARAWGEYSANLANAVSVMDANKRVIREAVSPGFAFTVTAFALLSQVGLFFLRFQSGTSDSAARVILIIGSAIIMISAAGVAIMEYRIASNRALQKGAGKNRGESIIQNYLDLHRSVKADLPRAIAEAERKELQAILQFLRELQRLGDLGGEHIRDALAAVIAETQQKIGKIELPDYKVPRELRADAEGPIGRAEQPGQASAADNY